MAMQLSKLKKKNIRLPSKDEIIEPTKELIKTLVTKRKYTKYSSKRGANSNRLSRGALIQAANPSLSLKQAQERGNRVYAQLQPAIDAKEQEALKKGWVSKLAKKDFPRKYANQPIKELIKETCDKFSTQSEIATYHNQLRTYLENTDIPIQDVCDIDEKFELLVGKVNQDIYTCWEVINIYWALFTGNRRYIGLDGNKIYASTNECLVGNYLYLMKIPFKEQVKLKSTKRIPDFELLEYNIYIEVLMCDPNDERRCACTEEREYYSNRTLDKIEEYKEICIQVRDINGDCSKIKVYEQVKKLMNEFYPDKEAPKFESVRKYHKDNLAYLLKMTDEDICKLVNDAGGTAKFRNNSFAEYYFLESNRDDFSKLLKKLKFNWRKEGQKRAVISRLKNSDYMSVQEHIEAIYNSNLRRAIGVEPWLNDRQALYNSWASHYETYHDIFEKLGVSKPPARFKLSFFKNVGQDNKNLKIAEFLYL
jgi:hypothetical protein